MSENSDPHKLREALDSMEPVTLELALGENAAPLRQTINEACAEIEREAARDAARAEIAKIRRNQKIAAGGAALTDPGDSDLHMEIAAA
jgi:hypothetical protein